MKEERQLLPDIAEHLRTWDLSARALNILLMVLAGGGIVCALAVTGFVDHLGTFNTRILAFISAVCFSVMSGLNIAKLAGNYRTAWRHLNAASMRYVRLESYTVEQLLQAYEEGERIIGHIQVHPDTTRTAEPQPKI